MILWHGKFLDPKAAAGRQDTLVDAHDPLLGEAADHLLVVQFRLTQPGNSLGGHVASGLVWHSANRVGDVAVAFVGSQWTVVLEGGYGFRASKGVHAGFKDAQWDFSLFLVVGSD